MLAVGTTAPGLHAAGPEPASLSRLSDFRGAKNVLLVFFPLAFTGICQGELDQLRDHLPDFENDDSAALAISVGPPPTHKIWAIAERLHLPGAVGLLAARRRSARPTACSTTTPASPTAGTFVVDRSGIIRFAEMKAAGRSRATSGCGRTRWRRCRA